MLTIMQKKDASSHTPVETSHARKKIISLFLLSPQVLSKSTLTCAPTRLGGGKAGEGGGEGGRRRRGRGDASTYGTLCLNECEQREI